MKILTYPNPKLLKKSEPITEMNIQIKNVISLMKETIKEANGDGLAAPQVGQNIQLILVCTLEDSEKILINPEITSQKGKVIGKEGCLSLPNITTEILRSSLITVKYQDEELKSQIYKAEGREARIIQHEIDHLEGKTIIQRASSIERIQMLNKLKKWKIKIK